MIVVLLGPPGAGKGTQAKLIAKNNNLFHFSTGNILREEVENKTEIGKIIESIINAGQLVSDDIIISIVDKIISKELSQHKGILFDGFPRNLDQANSLDNLLINKKKEINFVIHLSIDKGEVIKRIKKRKQEENRDDDNVSVLESRIHVYLKETRPLIDLYKNKNILEKVDGMKSIDEVNKNINKIFLKTNS